ncbi:MAG: ABC transporter substrate-binding protein [Burkholderiaceae bacterium]
MSRPISVRASRREIVRLTAGLGGMAALQGFGAVVGFGLAPAMAANLNITTLRSTSRSWLWAAEDFAIGAGHFDKAGLKVAMAATERGVNHDALLGGAADVLLGAPQQNMRVQILGKPVVVMAGFVNKFASNIVVRKEFADKAGVTEDSPVEAKAAVLKGLRLGTTGPGGGPDQLLRHFLRLAGADPTRDATLVPVRGGTAMIAAMQQKQIDGFCLSSPTSDLAVDKAGATYLFNMANNPPADLADFLYICASITEETGKTKADELTAYCRGIALALKAIHEDRDAFKTWARGWFSAMDDQLFETSFKNNINIYMKTPVPTQAQFDVNVRFLQEALKDAGQKPVPADYSYDKAFDLRFARKALESI